MPTPVVTEDWTKRVFRRGQSGTREFDISGVADEAGALAALAAYGVDDLSAWPVPAGDPIGVAENTIELRRNGRMWRAVVPYILGVNSDITYIDQKWQCHSDRDIVEEPLVVDANGLGIFNANKDPIETNLTRKRKTQVLEMTRFENGTDVIQKDLNFSNRWNTQPVTFPKIGTAAPGQALLDSISIAEDFSASAKKVRVKYRFLFRPTITATPPNRGASVQIHGFNVPVPNVGYRAWNGDSLQRILYGQKDVLNPTLPVPQPMLLNTYGVPFDTDVQVMKKGTGGAAPTYVTPDINPSIGNARAPYLIADGGLYFFYDPTDGSIDFNSLDIAANL